MLFVLLFQSCQFPLHRPNKGMHQKNVLHAWNKIALRVGTLLVVIIFKTCMSVDHFLQCCSSLEHSLFQVLPSFLVCNSISCCHFKFLKYDMNWQPQAQHLDDNLWFHFDLFYDCEHICGLIVVLCLSSGLPSVSVPQGCSPL